MHLQEPSAVPGHQDRKQVGRGARAKECGKGAKECGTGVKSQALYYRVFLKDAFIYAARSFIVSARSPPFMVC